jgi:hypothetical protein
MITLEDVKQWRKCLQEERLINKGHLQHTGRSRNPVHDAHEDMRNWLRLHGADNTAVEAARLWKTSTKTMRYHAEVVGITLHKHRTLTHG